MGHVPHLYIPPPWSGAEIELSPDSRHHLEGVLRLEAGEQVTYTDGQGTIGEGHLGAGGVIRGEEHREPSPSPRLIVAVAPPRVTARLRFLVEKLAELGVDRLDWLETRFEQGRPPRFAKAAAWTRAGLEQSRGAYLMETAGVASAPTADGSTWAAVPDGGPLPVVEGDVTLLVGPEGGFAPGELPEAAVPVGFGARILRTETAAVVAATLVLQAMGRFGPK